MSEAQQPFNALPQGHRLQEYELESVLGFGDFGITYLGTDHNLKKAVAIKEYLPFDFANRTTNHGVVPYASDVCDDYQWGLDRFLAEARTLAGFDHRHIIKVHRFFEENGTAYIVMEYAEGKTLADDLLLKRRLREAELKAILYPILDGLEVVHGADLLHQDITPNNIVIRDEDRSSVLLNFSAASQAIGTKRRPLAVMLTPGYAPIEQYSEQGDRGPWTDLYALGAVCYWALTDQVPDDARFRQPQSWVFAEFCDLRSPEGPHDVRFWQPEFRYSRWEVGRVSYAFLSAIDEALSVGKEDRPQSVGAWREALEDVDRVEVQAKKSYGECPEHSDGDTPLHYAARWNASSTAEVLLHWGEAVDASNEYGDTPLHYAAQEEDSSTAKVLLRWGADIHAKNNDGDTPLHLVEKRNSEVLLRRGADIHAKNNDGDTPLHVMGRITDSLKAEVLLCWGADIHAKNNDGDTPLHLAANYAGNGTSRMAEKLLRCGAAVDAKNNDGDTPLHVMAKWKLSTHHDLVLESSYESAGRLVYAASLTEGVLLHWGRAAVDAKNDDGETPLHVAAEYDNYWMAEKLLREGAAVNVRDRFGYTPLYVAMEYNASETASVLRRYGGR